MQGEEALLRHYLISLAVPVPEACGAALSASAEFVNAQRAAIATALQRLERAGQARLSRVCRLVASSPACSFEPRTQWGVCSLTGRTVRAMMRVRVCTDVDLDVDGKFGPFLLGLWHFAHMEGIEEARLQALPGEAGEAWNPARAQALYSEAGPEGSLALAYASSLQVVQQVMATTLRTLETSSGAPARRGVVADHDLLADVLEAERAAVLANRERVRACVHVVQDQQAQDGTTRILSDSGTWTSRH